MISIYLFTKESIYFQQMSYSILFVFNFYFQKNYLHLFYQKNLLQNFNLTIKNNFYCFYYKIMKISIKLKKILKNSKKL